MTRNRRTPHALLGETPKAAPRLSAFVHLMKEHGLQKESSNSTTIPRPTSPESCLNVLTDVSFVASPREKVGIVGRTGAGKSSLLMAVLRVLKASTGCIRIDDVDIASVSLRRLRSAVTVIPQDPCLTRGALRDVLDPTGSYSDSDVWCALAQAHLTEFVARHSHNIRMDVGDSGSNLSAGQRQLTTLRESFAYCTVLTIAHRLETVLDYDKILVMANGRTVEFGPTHELASNPDSAFHDMLRQAGLVPSNSPETYAQLATHL
ncbi:hypothetical protein MRX96_040425 [Rhipicephalus microplus]